MVPSQLDYAIVRTLSYGDVFKFPMTAAEIHYFLLDICATFEEVQTTLEKPSSWLKTYVMSDTIGDLVCYALIENEPSIFDRRLHCEQASAVLWPKARRYAILLGHLPFVQMVALTGALAVRNARDPNDDLDYLLVVRDGRVWLTRLFAVILVRICKLWGIVLCPNYVLAASALEQSQHDLFVAHEVTQMVPFIGHKLYWQMRHINRWTDRFLPNAQQIFHHVTDYKPRNLGNWLKKFGEWILGGAIGNHLESWEMHRKIRKFETHMPQTTEAQLDEKQVKGHFANYGQITLQRFHERLRSLGLEDNYNSAAD